MLYDKQNKIAESDKTYKQALSYYEKSFGDKFSKTVIVCKASVISIATITVMTKRSLTISALSKLEKS